MTIDLEGLSYGQRAAIERAVARRARASAPAARERRPRGPMPAPRLEPYPIRTWEPATRPAIDWFQTEAVAEELVAGLGREPGRRMRVLVKPTGYGKTADAVRSVALLAEGWEGDGPFPFVVVAPRALVAQGGWQDTIVAWNESGLGPRLDPLLVTTPTKWTRAIGDPVLKRDIADAMGPDGVVVIDECHGYKNPTSKRVRAMLTRTGSPEGPFTAMRKIGLTATPLANDPAVDAASYLILAGRYRNKSDYLRSNGLDAVLDDRGHVQCYDLTGHIDRALFPGYDDLMDDVARVLFRPDVSRVDALMPDVHEHLVQLPFDAALADDMASLAKAYRDRMFESVTDLRAAMVRRIVEDPARVRWAADTATAPGTVQPLVFFQHRVSRDALLAELASRGVEPAVVDGEHALDRSTAGTDAPVLVQYQAGSEGVEFPRSNTTVFYENQYSYIRLEQARGRNVRRGMGHRVDQWYAVSPCAFDQEVFDRVSSHEEINAEMLDEISIRAAGVGGGGR